MKHIPLADLGAEIRSTKVGNESIPSLWIDCPVCDDSHEYGNHKHVIHFKTGQPHGRGGVMWWANPSGSTVDDLTLAPSYLATSYRCRVHLFVRNGVVELLDDSHPVAELAAPPSVVTCE